ncbi:hypothetical protein CC80DRAFT_400945 [Byssothecium circinans]|uniref:Uncharacterized protein n=1 Tax=Byssothecium circinans TaxID=147558 RepID=A0A6A5U9M3_9PLEO|nr:hypothetical protein CC80DRAFT_400945 [Byssothecium circinans]
MRFTTTLVAFAMASFASAALHKAGVCVDTIGGQTVYNDDVTRKACDGYKARNTGTDHWSTCPDCVMVSNTFLCLPVCNSDAGHIGGDELNHYCTKFGARGSLAD